MNYDLAHTAVHHGVHYESGVVHHAGTDRLAIDKGPASIVRLVTGELYNLGGRKQVRGVVSARASTRVEFLGAEVLFHMLAGGLDQFGLGADLLYLHG